jgi:hypothetical protein
LGELTGKMKQRKNPDFKARWIRRLPDPAYRFGNNSFNICSISAEYIN